jgi:L-cysteine S-thiosulfotransferase
MADPMRIRAQSSGDKATVRVLMSHEMESGQRKDASGKTVPAWFIQEVTAKHNGKDVFSAEWGPAVSKNPFLQFAVKGAKAGDKIAVTWKDNKGDTRTDEATFRDRAKIKQRVKSKLHPLCLRITTEVTMNKASSLAMAIALALSTIPALAQKTASQGIDEYRAMLQDGNPADLFEAKGEDLWKKARGPKNASLEKCDLGKGPGVFKGAFVELPKYFADTQRVQDLESRLVTCMETLQGFNAAEISKTAFGRGEMANVTALATWIAAESKGQRFNLSQAHPQEKTFYEVGKRLFFQRGGSHDFSCASCHGEEGKRIRLQDLPILTKNPGDGVGFAAWPAYRVSNGQMWSMQLRLNDCYRQQRFPYPGFGSDATIALSTYLGVNAKGAASVAPAIKR